jgi:hypothetical protein
MGEIFLGRGTRLKKISARRFIQREKIPAQNTARDLTPIIRSLTLSIRITVKKLDRSSHFLMSPAGPGALSGAGDIIVNSTQSLNADRLGDETCAFIRHLPGREANVPTV